MSYDPALSRSLDRLRLAVGDTDVDNELLFDETYTAMLAYLGDDEDKTVIAIADALIVKFAQEPDRIRLAGDDGEVEWRNRLNGWKDLIARKKEDVASATGGFQIKRPSRFDEEACEYRADGRCPW